MSDIIVGIDLGTTNSEIAIVRDGQPHVLTEDGDPILPSCVGLSDDGKLLVGKAARNQWVLAPERTIRSIKRKMGQDIKVKLGDQEYRPQEISAMILRALRDRAVKELGQPVTKAVITVPAYFNDAQRAATREAGELAGLEVMRILNEPTAASLTYDPNQRDLRRMLVYDLGGGTFDVSVVQSQEGVVEVLSSHGDTQLGGDDFDDLLFKHLCLKFQTQHGIDPATSLATKARLLRASENAKKELSYHAVVRVQEEFLAEKDGQALHLDLEIARQEYEDLIRPLIDRTMDCVQRALNDSNLTGAQIDKVVLVGGSTRTPLISRLLEERLGQPAHQEVNPDLCVAMGASVQAGLIAGIEVGAVLVDITPHSMGIKCLDLMHGYDFPFRFAPIIHRNTPLPASCSEIFSTVQDRQRSVEIDVYQGENDDVRRNHRVGKFTIEGLAAVPAGNQLVVQLDLTLDGILKVSARERATGLTKQITIENALARFQREEGALARERLDELWQRSGLGEHAEDEDDDEVGEVPGGLGAEYDYEDDDEDGDGDEREPVEERVAAAAPHEPELAPGPREGQRETVQARALLEKAERLLQRVSAEDKVEVERLMNKLNTALTDRQWSQVTAACNELSDVLFYLEDA